MAKDEWPSFQNLPQNVKYKILTYFYENDNKLGWSQMASDDETIRKIDHFILKRHLIQIQSERSKGVKVDDP